MSESLLQPFYRMVDALQANPHIEITDVEFKDPVSADDIAATTKLAGGQFLDGMEEFYRETDGFRLEWRHDVAKVRKGDDRDTGAIDILPLRDVFASWQNMIWSDGPGSQRFKDLKPLDFFVPEACACVRHPDGQQLNPTIQYHQLGETVYDTGYSFKEYLDRLVASRGSWYWIETLCSATRDSPQANDFLYRMPYLFEDFRPELFRPAT